MELHQLLIAILGLFAINAQVFAKGINCKGSIRCNYYHVLPTVHFGHCNADLLHRHANFLNLLIQDLYDTAWIPANEQIACTPKGICAFLQHTDGMYGSEVKAIAKKLVDHGCEACGSVPRGYPLENDGSKGQLTFNFVNHRCGQAHTCQICPRFADDSAHAIFIDGSIEGPHDPPDEREPPPPPFRTDVPFPTGED